VDRFALDEGGRWVSACPSQRPLAFWVVTAWNLSSAVLSLPIVAQLRGRPRARDFDVSAIYVLGHLNCPARRAAEGHSDDPKALVFMRFRIARGT
jgi:hypothetical protein